MKVTKTAALGRAEGRAPGFPENGNATIGDDTIDSRSSRSLFGTVIATAFAFLLFVPTPATAKCDPLDGVVAFAEECDDGNLEDNDACKSDCTWNTCGDGLACTDNTSSGSACGQHGPTILEECDKAGEHGTCDGDCTLVACGDGYPNVTAGEECDDGDVKPGDGCEADCRWGRDARLRALDALKAASLVEVEAWLEDGIPTSVSMKIPLGEAAADPVAGALGFLYEYRDLYGIDDPEKDLFLDRVVLDADLRSVTFGQKVDGVRFDGGEIVVMISPDGDAVGTHGRWHLGLPPVAEAPGLTGKEAEAEAMKDTSFFVAVTGVAGDTRLEYFDPGFPHADSATPRLSWRVVLAGERKEGGGTLADFHVDAFTGEVLGVLDHERAAKDYDLNTANGATSEYCFDYFFDDESVQWFTESGATRDYPGRFPGGDADGDAMWRLTEASYNWWLRSFNWRGWDGSDEQIEAYVHYGGTGNAFANDSCMKFNNGMVTPDIFAHEYAHGVDKDTADLRYRFESGAISEAVADFFGTAVTGYPNWFIGEGSVASGCGAPAGAIRDMSNPPACGRPDPDHYSNFFATAESNDNGGVHTNSGILNKAFFLMSDGGTHRGITIPGDFGRRRTEFYLFKALRQRLSSSANMIDLRNEFLNGMRGVGEPRPPAVHFTTRELCGVINAFGSVGLGVGDIDSDCDGTRDTAETDDDNDGIPDARDNCPSTPSMNQSDVDGDGAGDLCDPDNDNDMVCDVGGNVLAGAPGAAGGCTIGPRGRDNCPRVPNQRQADFDNDGVGDFCEDSDGDGRFDAADNCPGLATNVVSDLDGDGLGDLCDPDSDNDGVCNSGGPLPARTPGAVLGCAPGPFQMDSCPNRFNSGADQNDVDGDFLLCEDFLPPNHRNYGCGNICDTCPDGYNPSQRDSDDDGFGDDCDNDRDGDFVANVFDNCPDFRNPSQADFDGDGQGFGCDPDDWAALVDSRGTFFAGSLQFASLTSPIETVMPSCIAPDCAPWLAPDQERRLVFELPAAMRVRIIDENGDVVAKADADFDPVLRFTPDPEWRYVAPKIPALARATGRGAEVEPFEGKTYRLQIFPAEKTVAGLPYPFGLGSVQAARCAREPVESCEVSLEPGKSPLAVKGGKGNRKITWKILEASGATLADFGDPASGGSYALCFYEEDSFSPNLSAELLIPGGGTCGKGEPCWSSIRVGKKGAAWRYTDAAGSHDGVRSILFKSGADGASSLTLKAVGPDVPVPVLPAMVPLRVQLQSSEGSCWQATYLPGSVSVNDETTLAAQGS